MKDKNHFDTDNMEAHISKILDWFAKGFGRNDKEVLLFVANFLSGWLSRRYQNQSHHHGRV